MCGEKLVAKRCTDRVWHWAHRPYSSQEKGTCLFEDSPWALQWRLGYHMFPSWQIELPKTTASGKTILLHAINPDTKQVREFVGKISDASEDRYQFLLRAKNHTVCWMFSGKEFVRAGTKTIGKDPTRQGFKDFLKPKAQALYDRICAAGQSAIVHCETDTGGKLYREWVKTTSVEGRPAERTNVWFPLDGDKSEAVLRNYSNVVLPYKNQPEKVSLSKLAELV